MSPPDDEELEDEFQLRIKKRAELLQQGKRDKGRAFWKYVGLIGAVGWGVVVPMLAGIFMGRFIDRHAGTMYRWTLGLLCLGLAVGCYNAWRMVTKGE